MLVITIYNSIKSKKTPIKFANDQLGNIYRLLKSDLIMIIFYIVPV